MWIGRKELCSQDRDISTLQSFLWERPGPEQPRCLCNSHSKALLEDAPMEHQGHLLTLSVPVLISIISFGEIPGLKGKQTSCQLALFPEFLWEKNRDSSRKQVKTFFHTVKTCTPSPAAHGFGRRCMRKETGTLGQHSRCTLCGNLSSEIRGMTTYPVIPNTLFFRKTCRIVQGQIISCSELSLKKILVYRARSLKGRG